ncbi:MAG: thioredoxin family protein, partial [Fluviibacter sp.]
QAAKTLEPRVRLAKVDTEAEQALGAQYGIRSIPTLALFKGGKEIARQAGAMGAADIVRWVQSHL